MLLAFPDWHVTVEDMFAQDNKVVTRWSLAATQLARYHDIPATGLKIYAEGIHIDHIVGDKIAKRLACNNFAEVFNRLRVMRAHSRLEDFNPDLRSRDPQVDGSLAPATKTGAWETA